MLPLRASLESPVLLPECCPGCVGGALCSATDAHLAWEELHVQPLMLTSHFAVYINPLFAILGTAILILLLPPVLYPINFSLKPLSQNKTSKQIKTGEIKSKIQRGVN